MMGFKKLNELMLAGGRSLQIVGAGGQQHSYSLVFNRLLFSSINFLI